MAASARAPLKSRCWNRMQPISRARAATTAAALCTVPDQTELSQRTPIVGIALATAGHGLRPTSSASWARWLRAFQLRQAARGLIPGAPNSREVISQTSSSMNWIGARSMNSVSSQFSLPSR
jgi:hypothetical protein